MPILRLLASAAPDGLPLARSVVRSGLARAFGDPPPFDAGADPGDPGLFGPGSASWRIVGEPAAIVGGVRALLVQLLHPLAMAGVADHSRFREDPLARLRRTSAYVTATTFGSLPQALAAARLVRGAHRPVTGLAPDGRPYRAGDPRLLAWVSVALTSSFLATDRAFAPQPADGATADALVAEQSRAAALLDPRVDLAALARDPGALRRGSAALPLLEEGLLPGTTAELAACLRSYAPELEVGPQGGQALRFLLWPRVPAWVRAGYLPLLGGAVATLDTADRARLGLAPLAPLSSPLELQARALLTGVRLLSGRSPALEAAARRAALPAPSAA